MSIFLKRKEIKQFNIILRKFTQNHKQKYKPVIGLEIHAQISTKSKLFSGASTIFAAPANQHVALFDAAIPGTLPVLNKSCVEAAVKTAVALNCKINPVSTFDRKHYFYTDLPFGYQITQQRNPIAREGELVFQVFTPGKHKQPYLKSSQLKQIQLEQDSGKSLHDIERSLIDLNRAGIPLMEFVFEPDLSDGEEAAALVKELSLILECLGTCSCKMEEGALRVDANVSVHEPGTPLGPRTEIKNIGSIRAVASAVAYEINRQIGVLNKNENVINETRAWDAIAKVTVPMRDKEEKQDYRFMPEPNLPPLHLQMPGVPNIFGQDLVNVDLLIKSIPKLPEQKRTELIDSYGLSLTNAIILVNEDILYNHFQNIMKKTKRNPHSVANILIMELLTVVHKTNVELTDRTISSDHLGDLVDMLTDEMINLATAREVLQNIVTGNTSKPREIVEQNNWMQITDDRQIEEICKNVLENNTDLVKQYRSGKNKIFKAFLGQIAKSTQNRINMSKVSIKLKQLLEN